MADVTPIFKKGSKSNPGNYRPVSLTSCVCKVMERLLKDKILEHLTKHHLIDNSQHAVCHIGLALQMMYLDFQNRR